MTEPKKIVPLFATPCYGGKLDVPYAVSMFETVSGLAAVGVRPLITLMSNESLIPRARNNIVAEFLAKSEATHLFFIDSDIGFNSNDIVAMLTSGFDVVFGAYPKKGINWGNIYDAVRKGEILVPEEIMAYGMEFAVNFRDDEHKEREFKALTKGEQVYLELKEGSTGFMCISRACIEQMVVAYPDRRYYLDGGSDEVRHDLFYTGIDPKPAVVGRPRYLSEDYGFCRLWQMLGGKCFLYLGAHLTHTGTFTFYGNIEQVFSRKA